MADLPYVQVFLIATWLEAVFYGLLVVLFFQSLVVLLQRRGIDHINKPMLIAVIIMFCIATTHLGLNIWRLIQAYVVHRLDDVDGTPGPVVYLGNLRDHVHIVKDTLYATQSLIGDALSIYRCFIVWNSNWRIIAFPMCMFAVSTVSGYMVCALYSVVSPTETVFDPRLTSWIKVFYSLALSQNVITTSLIAYRIWSTGQHAKAYVAGASNVLPVLRILVESAAFYSMAEMILITLYGLNYNSQYIVLESITPIVGITFTSIIIRVGMRASGGQSSAPSGRISNKHVPMHPITVNVSRRVEDDSELGDASLSHSYYDAGKFSSGDPK